MSTRYVALLRGINVGGNNLIRMADLKTCFEEMGFDDVATYIQSGNVLFTAARSTDLTARIEQALGARFDYRATVLLRSVRQLRDTVSRAPAGFGSDPGSFRYDVIFVRKPLTATAALRAVPVLPGVDEAHAGPGALYFSRLISQATRSRLNRIASLPIYQHVTIRNWNTTTKLLALLEASSA